MCYFLALLIVLNISLLTCLYKIRRMNEEENIRRKTYAAMQKDLLKEVIVLIGQKTEKDLFYGMEIAKYLRDILKFSRDTSMRHKEKGAAD